MKTNLFSKYQVRFGLLAAAGTWLGLAAAMTVPKAYAQGQGTGNGGHPAEVAEMQGALGARLESWYTVKQDLIQGLELGRHRELSFEAGVTAAQFYQSAMSSLKTTVLDFGDERVEIAGARRACKNWVDIAGVGRIYCDLGYLLETMKLFDSEAQYRFIAHEYLSVAGLEPNEYGSSSYFYSSQISKSLRSVQSKRWAAQGTEKNPGVRCELDIWRILFRKGYSITMSATSTEGEFVFSWSTPSSTNLAMRAPLVVKSYEDQYGYVFSNYLLEVPGEYNIEFSVQLSPNSAPFMAYEVKLSSGKTINGFHSMSCYRVDHLKPGFSPSSVSIASDPKEAKQVTDRLLKVLKKYNFNGR